MVSQAAHLALWGNPEAEIVGLQLGATSVDEVRAAKPDLLLSAAHRYYLPMEVLSLASLGSVGLHPSLLPAYRGSWPLWWALHHGERNVGMSLFVLDEGIDTGDILAQAVERVRAGDTFEGLYERVAPLAIPMVGWLIDQVVRTGRLPDGTPQNEAGASDYGVPSLLQRGVHRLLHPTRRRSTRRLNRPCG